ncbi:MAG TPA: T9SS type A sorting domain-containing protein [Flavobacterium sp.]|jgi:hypothetical protein
MKTKLLFLSLAAPFLTLTAQEFGPRVLVTPNDDNTNSISFEDIDADGDIDILASSNTSNSVFWYKNQGNGTFTNKIVLSSSFDNPRSVHALDVDGDGKKDIVLGEFDNGLSWIKNMGGGFFTAKQALTACGLCFVSNIRVGDIDNDGLDDIIIAELSNDVLTFYRNTGTGTFAYMGYTYIPADGLNINTYEFGDLDQDNINDIIVTISGSTQQQIIQFEYVADAFVQTPLFTATTSPLLYYSDLVDMDNDGLMDIVSRSSDCSVYWFKNFGANVYSTPNSIGLANCASGNLSAVGDLNLDNQAELVYMEDNTIHWRNNTGGGDISTTLTPISTSGIVGDVIGTYLVDIDQDGDKDVFYLTNNEFGRFMNDTSLGTNANTALKFSVYPNPATNELNIECPAGFSAYKMYDITGKLIGKVEMSVPTQNHKVNVGELSQGLYFLEIQSGSVKQTQKFIKN